MLAHLQPVVAGHDAVVLAQRAWRVLDELRRHRGVAVRLFQLGGGKPDGRVRWNLSPCLTSKSTGLTSASRSTEVSLYVQQSVHQPLWSGIPPC